MRSVTSFLVGLTVFAVPALSLSYAGPTEAPLPAGVKAVWDLEHAHREKTPTRARICLNGLWRWRPARDVADAVPAARWGYFKVPGFWPANTSYIQDDCQTLYAHPSWQGMPLRSTTAAWYQREMTVPAAWADRRIVLRADYVNSFALVFVDNKKISEVRFPGGEADLTSACRPGGKHVLSLLVVAMPLKGVLLSYSDTNSAKEVKGTVDRRGLCGDVYLVSRPAGARIADVKVDTSVRKGEITVSTALDGLAKDTAYALRVRVREGERIVREFASKPFRRTEVQGGRFAVSEKWKPDKLWDLHTPQNTFHAEVTLTQADGKVLDACHPVRFGFREFWIDGRDFYLNGSRIYLSAVPLDNAQISARTATYEGARETMRRLQSFGINFVYTHNYGCEPGSHVSFADILRAADDVGMLLAFSQPHFGHYQWKTPDADRNNGYGRHAEYYVRAAQNHPSVVAYSMSHNATGYDEDMNPDLIDGISDPRKDTWSRNNAGLASRAEAIVKRLDPGRIVYHHSSGNLGSMHTMNFYLNFVPIQEVSDWFEHWATKGVKPVFPCEYGVPFTWDWTMYRGWYKGQRSFGSARVPWEFCLAEWDAQFLGDRAYRISEAEKRNLRWEAGQFRAGKLWHRWDYPQPVGSSAFENRQTVLAQYITDNWRAHRTWGISANSPWEYSAFWKPRDGVDRRRIELKVDWENLQKPGFSPDYIQPRQGWMSVDLERNDWIPTAAAKALYRNNQPLLAYIGGKTGQVTSKDHNFFPGETVKKQLVIINNSRRPVNYRVDWSILVRKESKGSSVFQHSIAGAGPSSHPLPTGEKAHWPISLKLPAPGKYKLDATVRFDNGETQKDSFPLHVLQRSVDSAPKMNIALFDPRGETGKLLDSLKVRWQGVQAHDDLSAYDVLIVGRGALTVDGPGPDVSRVRDGLKVIVFEQSAKVLEQRFGFRVAEYGLRQVFPRVPDHPLLIGLEADHLRDWRGSATLLPPRLEYTLRPRHGPTVQWCGIDVSRAWRCGCRGNVASVLIEKPARGDFLPVLDGGFSLQYSPLLEYHEGNGMVLFCQMDVTGRTEAEPAAEILTRNILRHVAAWKPAHTRKAIYVGEPAGKRHFEAAGLSANPYRAEELAAGCVLIVGPGGGQKLADNAPALGKSLAAGGHLLAIGLDGEEANAFLPKRITTKRAEHIAAWFEAPGVKSLLAGVGPADVHNRDPRELPLLTAGANVIGNGVLGYSSNSNLVFCQIVPWQFEPQKQMNLKRTFRRSSYLVSRLAANLGAASSTPILSRFHTPVRTAEKRWLEGLYLDVPEEWDDPYRFFRW